MARQNLSSQDDELLQDGEDAESRPVSRSNGRDAEARDEVDHPNAPASALKSGSSRKLRSGSSRKFPSFDAEAPGGPSKLKKLLSADEGPSGGPSKLRCGSSGIDIFSVSRIQYGIRDELTTT